MDARRQVILLSPFLQLSKILFERLKDASNKGIEILIVFGKDDLKPNEKNSLAELRGLKLYYHENLHAKCYFNETKLIITSMNMYQFSENNNREMGVLVDANLDKELYRKALDEAQSIVKHSEVIRLQKSDRTYYHQQNEISGKNKNGRISPPSVGYCIRCSTRIDYDPFKPFCFSCFTSWAGFENPNYKEKVCHCCGEYSHTSMAYPVCEHCFKKFPFM